MKTEAPPRRGRKLTRSYKTEQFMSSYANLNTALGLIRAHNDEFPHMRIPVRELQRALSRQLNTIVEKIA